jgi:SSS family solute:Na+ symporter
MYPHAVTGVLASRRRNVIRFNTAILPAYTLMLGLVALLGYMALAAPGVRQAVKVNGANPQLAVPFLFQNMFPPWFAGIAYSAIVIGALVPAAIMSIAAANLFTRNIYKEYFKPDATPAQQVRVAQTVSLMVKLGALIFVLALSKTFSINLQLLGGIWILQTFPAIVAGLYTRWFHRWALMTGWAVAMVYGTITAYNTPAPGVPGSHFGASTANVPGLNHTVYIALTALVINLVVAVLLTAVFRLANLPAGTDETAPAHYHADPPGVLRAKVPITRMTVERTPADRT